jgi:hypothetical protein
VYGRSGQSLDTSDAIVAAFSMAHPGVSRRNSRAMLSIVQCATIQRNPVAICALGEGEMVRASMQVS